MILVGERCNPAVRLVPITGTEKITRVTSTASDAIASEIRTSVCIDCPVFDIGCRGAGRVTGEGYIKEKNGGPIVVYQDCKIPGSSIPYSGFDVTTEPLR